MIPPFAGTAGSGGSPLCPATAGTFNGTGGVIIVDGGAEAGEAGHPPTAGAPNTGGQAGATGDGMSGSGGEGGVSGGEGGMSGASAEGGMSGAGDSAGAAGMPPTTGCPATEPEVGPCAEEGLPCMYGDAVNVTCRRLWTCFNGLWSSSLPCTPEQAEACPGAAPTHGSSCATQVSCAYPDGNNCECTYCGNDTCWACNGSPNSNPGCPQRLPPAGSACS